MTAQGAALGYNHPKNPKPQRGDPKSQFRRDEFVWD